MMRVYINGFLVFSAFLAAALVWHGFSESPAPEILTAAARVESFDVTVKTVGLLEAENSVVVYSSIKGDQGKIIDIVKDGRSVDKGDVLVRLDPTPFEQKLEEIEAKIREQKAVIESLNQTLSAEKDKADLEIKAAEYEMENAEAERNKIVMGDGPMEEAKLERALTKAEAQYLDLNSYESELDRLQEQGYLSRGEKKQAVKRLEEAKEAFEDAKMQYDSFSKHVYPMQKRKAELNLKRAMIKYEDAAKAAAYKVAKAEHTLEQATLGMKHLQRQKNEVLREIRMTEIRAPGPGMVVLREEFRSGEKRKPRVGDIALKNQPLLNLPDLSRMLVTTKVREVDLHKISVGKSAHVEIDAFPGLTLFGKVVSIGVLATAAFRQSEEKYFDVGILLDPVREPLRPGMTARVRIHSKSVEETIAVPVNAVFFNESECFCYKKSKGGFAPFPVTLGFSNESLVEVTSGIDAGDVVSLLPPDFMP